MTYSRKRYWLALGAALAIAAVFLVLNPRLHPAPASRLLMSTAVVALCSVLSFLAYFSLDEIQRQNRMRAWYYGGPLAILFAVVPFFMVVSDRALEAIVGFLSGASRIDTVHSPKIYFVLGIAVTCLAQLIGNYMARVILAKRTADE